MKKVISFLLAIALVIACAPVIPITANAATSGYYTYTVSNGEATITDCDESISGDITIPATLGGYPVTCIGNYAFDDCSSLTSVEIPDSVTSIGSSAFYYCSSLTSITISDSVTCIGDRAFIGCSSLTSVVIPDGVTCIGDRAFAGCESLTSMVIPDGVTSIGKGMFYGCDSLTSITIPDSVTSIGDDAFRYCFGPNTVYYAGSQEQWKAINIGSNNSDLTNATIHYNHTHDYSLVPPVVVAPTCTQEGYTQYTCIHGEVYKKYTPALGHEHSGKETVIAPTCTEQGYTKVQCSRCNATYKINYTDALGGHKMVVIPAKEATCTTDGTTVGSKCERCDYYGITPTTIPATGHNVVNGVCTNCEFSAIIAHKQSNTETYYSTLEEALAVTEGIITLLADVTADVVSINPGVTLDLKGYTLTANSVTGYVMDSSDGKGLVKVGAKNAALTSSDDQLILWDNTTDNSGYRVFNYTFTNMGMDAHKDDATESAKRGTTLKSFWSDLVFTNPYAYTLAASAYSTLSVGFEVSWTPEGGAATSKTFTFGTSVVADWGAAEESNAGDKNYCFYIGLTGFDDLLTDGTVEVKPVVKTAFNTDEAVSTQIKYDYVKPAPGGLVYEYGFGNLNK